MRESQLAKVNLSVNLIEINPNLFNSFRQNHREFLHFLKTLRFLGRLVCATYNAAGISSITLLSLPKDAVSGAAGRISNIRSKGDPVSAIPGTQLVGEIYEVDNLRFANHAIEGLLIDMRRRAEGRKAGWLRDLFDD